MKTCPLCETKAYLAVRKCKNPDCGWNFVLKVQDRDGTLAAAAPPGPNQRGKRNAADILAGTPYIPTGAGPLAVAAATAAQQAKRQARELAPASVSTRVGNVSSHSHISLEDDGNMDTCVVCGDMGMLICCEICPLSYHADCAGLRTVPQGFWSCPQVRHRRAGRRPRPPHVVASTDRSRTRKSASMLLLLLILITPRVVLACFLLSQCTQKNLTAAATAAAAASASAAGAKSGGGAASAAAAASRPAALLAAHTLSIQDGLDPFHQRLNACLDYSHAPMYEMDGYTFQCFAPPNLQALDPATQGAAAAQTPAQAQAQKAAAAARAAQAVSSQQQQQQQQQQTAVAQPAAPAASS